MNRDLGSVAKTSIEVKEGVVLVHPSVTTAFSIHIAGTGTLVVTSSALYLGSTDMSSTCLSGSTSVSGRVITTKDISSLVGGQQYQLIIYYTDGGYGQVRIVNIQCIQLGVNPAKYQNSDYRKYCPDENPIEILPGQSIAVYLVSAGAGWK